MGGGHRSEHNMHEVHTNLPFYAEIIKFGQILTHWYLGEGERKFFWGKYPHACGATTTDRSTIGMREKNIMMSTEDDNVMETSVMMTVIKTKKNDNHSENTMTDTCIDNNDSGMVITIYDAGRKRS